MPGPPTVWRMLMQILIIRPSAPASSTPSKTGATLAGAALRERLIAAHSAVLCQLAATKMGRLASGRPLIPGDDLDLAREAAQHAIEGIGRLVKFRAHMLAARIRRATMRPWESDLPHAADQYKALRHAALVELGLARMALADAEAVLFRLKRRRRKNLGVSSCAAPQARDVTLPQLSVSMFSHPASTGPRAAVRHQWPRRSTMP